MAVVNISELVQRRQPFVIEARPRPGADSFGYERAVNALNREAMRVQKADPRWRAELEYVQAAGTYRLHMKPIDATREFAAGFVGGIAASIIVGTLLGAIGSHQQRR